ncbi:MAG: hypothetical protein CK424_02260 [Legionella sp.]|nr:MAG: hypothetical protein CK424_02260 [Legionella sp.]
MNENIKQKDKLNIETYDLLKGIIIGIANATAVTPVANLSNRVVIRRRNPAIILPKLTLNRAYDGLLQYNLSFVLRLGIALPLNTLLVRLADNHDVISEKQKLLLSVAAGGIAGIAASIPEAVAQTQQQSTHKLSALSIVQAAYRNNGFWGLTRGMPMVIGRTAGFTAGYLSFMPYITESMRAKWPNNKGAADLVAAVVCGMGVGLMTTPFHQLRCVMQDKFIERKPADITYRALLKKACQSKAGMRNSFSGLVPRTVMSMMSMWIIFQGNEQAGHIYAKNGFPTLLNFKP